MFDSTKRYFGVFATRFTGVSSDPHVCLILAEINGFIGAVFIFLTLKRTQLFKMHALGMLWAANNEESLQRRLTRRRNRQKIEKIEAMPESEFINTNWLIIMTSAINAISPCDFATEWMPMRLRSARHWVLQVLGGIIIITGFLIILSNKFIHDKPHFASLHAKFGLTSLIFMLVTILGGLGALASLQLKHYLAPIYTKLIHATLGLVTFILGIITILLGLFSNWWTYGDVLRYASLVLVLAIMLCTILRPSLKVYFRVKERLENTN